MFNTTMKFTACIIDCLMNRGLTKTMVSALLESLTYTCGGVHLGRVEQEPPIELTTPCIEAQQVRCSCVSSIEKLSPSPFSIARSRRFAVRRGVLGLPFCGVSSVHLNLSCLQTKVKGLNSLESHKFTHAVERAVLQHMHCTL